MSKSRAGKSQVVSYSGIPKDRHQFVRAMLEVHKYADPRTKLVTPKQVWKGIQEGRLKEQAEKAERERLAAEKENQQVDTGRISCVLNDVQDQLRALVYVARTDSLEEAYDGEALRTLAENISIRCHLMLDECLKQMGHVWAGNFEDSFKDLDERRGVAQ